jgi:hypothetical protein
MKNKEHWLLPSFTIFVFLFVRFLQFPLPVFAHPGRTASDGCHYCRTNCDSWGVPWNTRHCHGGGVITPTISTPKPVYTIVPTPRATVRPTLKPTTTPSPEVQGVTTQNTPAPISSPSPTPAPLTTGGVIGVLGFLAVLIGLPIWGIVKIIKKFRKPRIAD